jgi:molybdate transport system ATP-binding protein
MIIIDINKNIHGSNGEINLNINLNINKNDLVVLTGLSGSGKTTFLRILAGLEIANGTIKVDGIIWLNKKNIIPPQKRNIGFVFQDYALFPNMNIEDNLLFVKNDKEFANYLLKITELTNLKYKLPNNLSGGQKQRVAICRALMNKPKLLLMDEPFSALDTNIKEKIYTKLQHILKEFNITTIIVTHEINEIKKLASKVIILENGTINKNKKNNATLSNINYGKIIKINNNQITLEIPDTTISNLQIGQIININPNYDNLC